MDNSIRGLNVYRMYTNVRSSSTKQSYWFVRKSFLSEKQSSHDLVISARLEKRTNHDRINQTHVYCSDVEWML